LGRKGKIDGKKRKAADEKDEAAGMMKGVHGGEVSENDKQERTNAKLERKRNDSKRMAIRGGKTRGDV
jgi:hypothetical protein